MDAQRQIVEDFKRDLPEIVEGFDPSPVVYDLSEYRARGQVKSQWCMIRNCKSVSHSKGLCTKHLYHFQKVFA